jgi:hypothetical protein
MAEPVDVYADQFQVHTGPYGCTLNFLLTGPTPPAPGSPVQAGRIATVRMSLEHLKVMTYMLRQQVLEYERRTATSVQLPPEMLNQLGIGREDWDGLWKR